MTAAHCTDGGNVANMRVHVGEHDLSESDDEAIVIRVKKVHQHPNYNSSTNDRDFSLLELSEDLVFSRPVKPACLPEDDSKDYIGEQGIKVS